MVDACATRLQNRGCRFESGRPCWPLKSGSGCASCEAGRLRGAGTGVVQRRGYVGLVGEAERHPRCGDRLLRCEVVEGAACDRVEA
jgi:hypothetical protein